MEADQTLELGQYLVWDHRTLCWRAPAYRYQQVVEELCQRRFVFEDQLTANEDCHLGSWSQPDLRSYQQDALNAWEAFGRRGVIVLPTGSGKTRVAISAMASTRSSCVVLCPTRALLGQWKQHLEEFCPGPVGVVGDGECRLERVTVMTFESAYRRLDELGARFQMLVVDEAHHFARGRRSEALEMSPAKYRMGLTATAPAPNSEQDSRLSELLGPVVFELGVHELVGKHLAPYHRVRLALRLEPEEALQYEKLQRPFAELRRCLLKTHPGLNYESILRTVSQSRAGREALRNYHQACTLAAFPIAKRRMVATLLERHKADKKLVFTAFADHAYCLAFDNLVPVVTSEVKRAEREAILSGFREGRLNTIVSARVLNEGIDVPDAAVAILVGGALGTREYIQRIGRVLRPQPGKIALVYELVSLGTIDDVRWRWRERNLAA